MDGSLPDGGVGVKLCLILGVRMMRVFILGNECMPGAQRVAIIKVGKMLPIACSNKERLPQCDGFLNIFSHRAKWSAFISKWDLHLFKHYLHPVRQRPIKANIHYPSCVPVQFKQCKQIAL